MGLVALVALTGFLATGTTGCSTVNTAVTTNNIAQVESLVTTLSADSVILLLSQEGTNARPYVVAVGAVINTVSKGTDYSPAALTKALQGLPLNGINTANAKLAIDAISMTYSLYFANYVSGQANSNLIAQALLNGLGNGITQALSYTPAQLSAHRSLKR